MNLKTTSAASWAGTGAVRRLRDPQVGLQPTCYNHFFTDLMKYNTFIYFVPSVTEKNKYEGKSATCCGTSNIPSSTQVREKYRS